MTQPIRSRPYVGVSLKRDLDPVDKCAQAIDKAEESVWAAVYKFNNKRMLRAIRDAVDDEIQVRLLVDRWQVNGKERSFVGKAAKRGAEVRVWRKRKLHAKFTIIDQSRVLTGSYNWTNSGAGQNVELLLTFDEPAVITAFQRRFREMWRMAEPWTKR